MTIQTRQNQMVTRSFEVKQIDIFSFPNATVASQNP
jgi:hypothetical protein